MKSGEKLIFIDYLKSFSMLYIVGYWHLFDYTDFFPAYLYPASEVLSVITLGVFTFISGFLSGKSVMKTPKTLDFYGKRIVRIYPLYLVAVALFLIYGIKDGITAWKSIFLLSMLHGPAPRTLWFITMIMLFYLIAPILVRLSTSIKKYIIFAISLMFLMFALMLVARTVDIRLILYFPCFCAGIYCAIEGLENQLINIKYALISLAVSLILSFVVTDWWTLEQLERIFFILPASYLIFLISYRKRSSFSNTRFIMLLSYSSYGMYLFHRPIYETLKDLYFPEATWLQAAYLISICLFIIVFIAWCFQQANDRLYALAYGWFQRHYSSNN